MDPFVFLLAGIAIAVPLIAKSVFLHSICWKEWALQTAILGVVLIGGFALARAGQSHDIRILNGEITSKYRDTVSCEHSYACNCRSVTRGDKIVQECDTCHEHFNDYDWVLQTSVGRLKVGRIDRQGSREPPRYTRALIGDPVAVQQSWTNYVKAAPHSVFREDLSTDDVSLVPPYPSKIHDIHYLDRVIDLRAGAGDMADWNHDLAQRLKAIGAATRSNIVILITDRKDRAFAGIVERGWLRGKSNDTTVLLGVEADRVIWAEAFGWSDNPRLFVELRHVLEGLELKPGIVLPVIEATVLTHYKAMPDDRHDHLAAEVRLSGLGYILLGILALALSAGTTFFFHRNQTFTTSSRFHARPFRRSH